MRGSSRRFIFEDSSTSSAHIRSNENASETVFIASIEDWYNRATPSSPNMESAEYANPLMPLSGLLTLPLESTVASPKTCLPAQARSDTTVSNSFEFSCRMTFISSAIFLIFSTTLISCDCGCFCGELKSLSFAIVVPSFVTASMTSVTAASDSESGFFIEPLVFVSILDSSSCSGAFALVLDFISLSSALDSFCI